MQEQYYVSHDGQELGPFSVAEIHAKLRNHELLPLDYIYVEAKEDWVPIGESEVYAHFRMEDEATTEFESFESFGEPVEEPQTVVLTTVAPQVPQEPVVEETTAVAAIELTHEEEAEEEEPVLPEPVVQPVVEAKVERQHHESAPPVTEAKHAHKDPEPHHEAQPQHGPAASALKDFEFGLIQIVNGVGSIDFSHFTAERVRLLLSEGQQAGLEISEEGELTVKAGPATRLQIAGPLETAAGHPATLTFEALDAFGNFDEQFNGQFNVQLSGSAQASGALKIHQGVGTLSITDTVAEDVSIRVVDSNKTGLDVSCKHELRVVAGPAKRFALICPEETVAGQPISVMIKAVDAYGNLATNCQSAVKLSVQPVSGHDHHPHHDKRRVS